MKTKPNGKPKFPPTTRERVQITSMTAAGLSQNKIARKIGRSRGLVAGVLAEPEIQRAVKIEKEELSRLCMEKGRTIIDSINQADIEKAGLRDKAVAGAVMVDKALVLAGEPTSIDVSVLLNVAELIRLRQQGSGGALPQAPALPPPEPEV